MAHNILYYTIVLSNVGPAQSSAIFQVLVDASKRNRMFFLQECENIKLLARIPTARLNWIRVTNDKRSTQATVKPGARPNIFQAADRQVFEAKVRS